MNIKDFNQLLMKKRRELDELMQRKMPVKVGAMAKGFYQDNIAERQGFLNNGLTSWPKTRRQLSGGKSASAKYGALLSSRNHLFNSILYIPGEYRVKISNPLDYAPIHNQGGTVTPTITPKMRKFAWAMYYKEAGIKKTASKKGKKKRAIQAPENALLWKRLALTRKKRLNIKIPQRQFLGESKELNEQIRTKLDSEIRNILNS